jgi:hypothetical protein
MLAALGDQKRNELAVYATLDVLAYLIVNEVGYDDQCGTLGGVEFFADLLRESVTRASVGAPDIPLTSTTQILADVWGTRSPKVSDK